MTVTIKTSGSVLPEIRDLAREAKIFVAEAGEGQIADRLLIRAAMGLLMLVREDRSRACAGLGPLGLDYAVATLAECFCEGEGHDTAGRLALLAEPLEVTGG